MRILVACEFSGIVREAFRKRGHDAWSCDLLPTEIPGKHIQDDVLNHLYSAWDLMIAHPPCTYLSVSGARWFKERMPQQENAAWFFMQLWNASIPKIALEQPVSVMSTRFRKPDQTYQPYHFGIPESKLTCLWLKNLPQLIPTGIKGYWTKIVPRVHLEPPSPDRWKNRSRTLPAIAEQMAIQWG